MQQFLRESSGSISAWNVVSLLLSIVKAQVSAPSLEVFQLVMGQVCECDLGQWTA